MRTNRLLKAIIRPSTNLDIHRASRSLPYCEINLLASSWEMDGASDLRVLDMQGLIDDGAILKNASDVFAE